MKFRKLGALAGVSVLALAACTSTPGASGGGGGGGSKGTIDFGIELPQQGSELAASQAIINGIKLAVKDAGGSAGGWNVEIPNSVVLDDAKDGVHDPQTAHAVNSESTVENRAPVLQ